MSKTYHLSLRFRFVRKLVIWAFKNYYNKYIVVGRENLPEKGPIIFAPNHRNALMDALAVVSIGSNQYSTWFLARSDIFKNKILAKFLNTAKIMPAFRSRDGIENLGKNAAIFEKCIDLLMHKNAMCIMPEGNQALDKRIRPLAKGIFRIAFSTQEQLPNQAVKIIPIGIDYGDIIKARKHIIINIGKPIDMRDYMSQYSENQPLAINEIRSKLSDELRKITIDIDSRENYDGFESISQITEQAFLEKLELENTAINKFIAQKKIISELTKIEKTDKNKMNSLVSKSKLYVENIKALNLKPFILNSSIPNLGILIIDCFLLITTFPVFFQGWLLNFLPFFSPVFIRKYLIKPKFTGFFSSIQFVIGIISFPLFYGIQTILLAIFTQLPFWAILLFIPLQFIIGKWALAWYREFIKYRARVRYYIANVNKFELLSQTIQLKNEIISEVMR